MNKDPNKIFKIAFSHKWVFLGMINLKRLILDKYLIKSIFKKNFHEQKILVVSSNKTLTEAIDGPI